MVPRLAARLVGPLRSVLVGASRAGESHAGLWVEEGTLAGLPVRWRGRCMLGAYLTPGKGVVGVRPSGVLGRGVEPFELELVGADLVDAEGPPGRLRGHMGSVHLRTPDMTVHALMEHCDLASFLLDLTFPGHDALALLACERLVAELQTCVLCSDARRLLWARTDVARARARTGDVDAAVREYDALVADWTGFAGACDLGTLNTRQLLALLRGEEGARSRAAADLAEIVALRTRVQGADHRDVLTARSWLARFTGEAGDTESALAAYRDLLLDYTRILGADDATTLWARDHVAAWLGESGDHEGAVLLYEQLLADRTRVLGPEHEDTTWTREQLDEWRKR